MQWWSVCVKNYITCADLWVDEVNEMITVEVKGRDPKNTWEILGNYRAPNKDMRLLEKLADQTRYMERTMKCSFIGGDLNLPYADWNGHMEKSRGTQLFLNRLVWEHGYTQVVNSLNRGDIWLDFYIVQPEIMLTSCRNVQGISDHCGGTTGSKMGRKLP